MCREMQRQIPAREAYSMSKTVSGTRCHQSFVSMYPRRGRGTGNAAALCNDICTKILLGDSNTELDTLPKTVLAGSNNFQHGNYIACNVRPGMVHREHFKHPDEHNDAYVNFMNTILSWAQKSVLNAFSRHLVYHQCSRTAKTWKSPVYIVFYYKLWWYKCTSANFLK